METIDLPQNFAHEDNNNDTNEFDQYRQRSTQADTLEQRFAVFDGEWIVRSTLLRDISPNIRTFKSKGIIISPISNQNSIEQIIDIIRQVTLVLQLRVTWRDLPSEWLTSENALFATDRHVSLYNPLRDEVTATSDGDGIHDFHQSPCNVGSPGIRLLPRCITPSGMKISSLSSGRATDPGISLFFQFLPLHWGLDHLTETLLQHRQLHRLFTSILCTAIELTVLCLSSYSALCIARLLNG